MNRMVFVCAPDWRVLVLLPSAKRAFRDAIAAIATEFHPGITARPAYWVSIPDWPAFRAVMEEHYPDWTIHEVDPSVPWARGGLAVV